MKGDTVQIEKRYRVCLLREGYALLLTNELNFRKDVFFADILSEAEHSSLAGGGSPRRY